MIRLCFEQQTDMGCKTQWHHVLNNFQPDEVCIVGSQQEGKLIWPNATYLNSYSDLIPLGSLIIASPETGQSIPGTLNLKDFTHPEDATYVFGHDNLILQASEFEGKTYSAVYVPTIEMEMWSWVAAAVILYDRLVKNG